MTNPAFSDSQKHRGSGTGEGAYCGWDDNTGSDPDDGILQVLFPPQGASSGAAATTLGASSRKSGSHENSPLEEEGFATFQMAEVAVPRQMFQEILSLIARLRAPPAPA